MCSTIKVPCGGNVAVYVNGQPVHDRIRLTDPVGTHDEIYVFQALSGG
jgi:molybdopterin synthase sulfur carrier subunit